MYLYVNDLGIPIPCYKSATLPQIFVPQNQFPCSSQFPDIHISLIEHQLPILFPIQESYFRRLSTMLLSKSFYFLSVVFYATATALPLDDVEGATVAEDRNAK